MKPLRIALAAALLAIAAPAFADPQEEAAWRFAVRGGGVADYGDFLSRYPQGNFAPFARNRIAASGAGAPPSPLVAAPLSEPSEIDAAAVEAEMKLGAAERMAVEDGLIARGLASGPPTGAFGEEVRAAIRAWQAARGLRPTGHLTEAQYDELTTAPLSGAIPAGEPMTARLGSAPGADAREAALLYGPEELAEIEERLARAGFDPGEADGALDHQARSAIRAFRISRGFAPHAFLDRPMVEALMRETASWPGPVAARP